MLDAVETTPSTSIRVVAIKVSLQNVLNAEFLHAFHLQRIQLLLLDYHPGVLHGGICNKSAPDVNFPASLFTDEATFNREGVLNLHDAHLWPKKNSHGVQHNIASQ
ncbi:hypothetical protein CEXT_483711 [Caerostris extrusa]|uniref:Uncharacterized protein n=1 Tax=Caerostris extrusa TaxID=172846 RepID=A0AAV4VP48_CAEEX|nr:hypothetical protein CEXT_483711 [Caerostris extrusa]